MLLKWTQLLPAMIMLWFGSFVLPSSLKGDDKAAAGYPRAELLIEVDELAALAAAGKLVLLDARENAKYSEGHIPGAVWVDAAAWGKAVSEDDAAASWTKRFAGLGINTDSTVVVYDDQRQRSAARTWWVLKLWGVPNARLLNGGWSAYVDAKGPVETKAPEAKPGSIVARHDVKAIATKDELLTGLKNPGKALQLVDTRSKEEHCGTNESRSKNKGTIPGSKHLEWSDLLVPETSRFRPSAEIARLFKDADIDIEKPSATYCQGGGRASVTAFVLELMGSPEARNYYPGWGEWGNDESAPFEKPAF